MDEGFLRLFQHFIMLCVLCRQHCYIERILETHNSKHFYYLSRKDNPACLSLEVGTQKLHGQDKPFKNVGRYSTLYCTINKNKILN